MNKEIKIYTDLDSWFDYRKGLLFKLITDPAKSTLERLNQAGSKWDAYAEKLYSERRIENFTYPHLNVTHEQFLEAFNSRTVDDIAFYLPSNLSRILFKTVMEIEGEYEQYRGIKSIKIHVNLFPYNVPDDLLQDLEKGIKGLFRSKIDIDFINKPLDKLIPHFFRDYDYVYKYDILLSKAYENFLIALPKQPIPETVFFVPDIYIKATEHITGKPGDVIDAFAYSVASHIGIRSIHHSVYDNTAT